MMAWTRTKIIAASIAAVAISGAGSFVAVKSAVAEDRTTVKTTPAAPEAPAAKAQATAAVDKKANNGLISVATSPPVVVSTVPPAGSTDVDAAATTELKVTFSKDMETGNFSWVQFGKDTFPKTTGKPKFLDDKRTCVLPVKLEPGHPYVIWLNKAPYDSFMDTDSHKSVPYLLVFETKQ